MSEELDNAADPRKIRDAGRREKRLESQNGDDLRELMQLPAGRRFLSRLIFDVCAVYQTSYHPSGQQFAANEGRRGVGVQVQAELMVADLEGFLGLVRTHQVKPDV